MVSEPPRPRVVMLPRVFVDALEAGHDDDLALGHGLAMRAVEMRTMRALVCVLCGGDDADLGSR